MEELSSRGQPRARIEIDLNSRDRNGHVRTRLHRADRPVKVGDKVTAFEPDDQVAAIAIVAGIDSKSGFLLLDVDWSTLADDYRVISLSIPNITETSSVSSPSWLSYKPRYAAERSEAKEALLAALRKLKWRTKRRRTSPSERMRLLRRFSYIRSSTISRTSASVTEVLNVQADWASQRESTASTYIPVRLQEVIKR